jgi:hypothetical protein
MQITGNIVVSLALFLYALTLQLLLHDVTQKRDQGGALWGSLFIILPLWILLTIGMLLATARGGFDWLPVSRGTQYFIAALFGIALLVVTFFSFLTKIEHAGQLPWAVRPFGAWALFLFPPVAMAFVFLTLNSSLSGKISLPTRSAPLIFIGALSLLACIAMLGQWVMHAQRKQVARAERAVAAHNERDRNIMERLQTLSATNDFAELLGFANRFENPDIRKVAIEKAQSHPEFMAALKRVLDNGWVSQALVYLDACDIADPKVLATSVREAIAVLTEDAKDSVARTHTFHADQFDWNTRLILSVADKFSEAGVDYVPAIRVYRATLDSQRTRDVKINARQTLDAWLAKYSNTSKI